MNEEYLYHIISFGLMMQNDLTAAQIRRKVEIREEWKRSADYPRKKKKKVRKQLVLSLAICNWDIFNF